MQNAGLVSVIMPAYNAQEFIAEAIQSVLAQTYTHWELIIINDGSTDQTQIIAQQFAEQDQRIRLITQKNQGVSTARNTGLSQAQGGYISFIDSDDKYHDTYLEKLYHQAQKTGADFVYCGIFHQKINKNFPSKFTEKEILHEIYVKHEEVVSIYAILFKKDLIRNLTFDITEKIGEDQQFVVTCLLRAKNNTSCIPETLYFYRWNPSSAINAMNAYALASRISSLKKMYNNVHFNYSGDNKSYVVQGFHDIYKKYLIAFIPTFHSLIKQKKI